MSVNHIRAGQLQAINAQISEILAENKSMSGLTSTDTFAISCNDGYEIQITVTNDKEVCIGEVGKVFNE